MPEKCGKCKKTVKENENGLVCETCERWYHPSCQSVNPELYKMLQKYEEQLWFCGDCKPEIKKNVERVRELEQKNDEMEQKLKIMEEKWETLKEDITREVIDRVREERNENIVKQTTESVLQHLREENEKNKRKENIIMYNVMESEKENTEDRIKEDRARVTDVIENSLEVQDYAIEKIVRLGRKEDDRNRPLLIKFRNVTEKWNVVKNAKKMKNERDVNKKRIGIALDMTEKEREIEKILVTELKRRRANGEQGLYIKNGKLAKAREEN